MNVLNKKAFKLPFIQKDKFVQLLRFGLGYDKAHGHYFIKDYNNLEQILDILSDVLKENVSFLQTCIICKGNILCTDCQYNNSCATKDLPLQCLCKECAEHTDTYDNYVRIFEESTDT